MSETRESRLLADWENARSHLRDSNLPTLVSTRVAADPKEFDDHGRLWQHLVAFAPKQGWLCFQGRVAHFNDNALPARDDSKDGWVIAGEMVNGQISCSIRQTRSGWQIVTITEGEGRSVIAEDAIMLATDEDTLGELRYRIYREWSEERGFEARFARFTGFSKGGN